MKGFLTDEHISPAVAKQARRKCKGIEITAIQQWRGGAFLGVADEVFIPQAGKEGLVVVSYDQRTLLPLVKIWAEAGVNHGGMVLVDQRTIDPRNIGRLVGALCELWEMEHRTDWSNRIVFLRARH